MAQYRNLTCSGCGEEFFGWHRRAYCGDQCRIKHNVEPTEGGCWNWKLAVNDKGYGLVEAHGKTNAAHVFSFKVFKGQPQHSVCHTCDNALCVNPEHLYDGTPKQNVEDMRSRRRLCVGEAHSASKLTEADVRAIRADPRGYSKVARDYNITPSTAARIRNRTTWKHVT